MLIRVKVQPLPPSFRIIIFSIGVLVIDSLLKWQLLNFRTGLIAINQGVAFGLGDQQSYYLGLGLIIITGYLYKFKPIALWISLFLSLVITLIERSLFAGAIDYLNLAKLQLNLTDLLIIGLVFSIFRSNLLYSQPKITKSS